MTYDDALEQLCRLDPQWSAWGSDGLQNHTTMVAHALHVMGFDSRIASQLERTRERYRPLRAPSGESAPELGDGRVPEWVEHWSAAIAREGWQATLRRASRELAPGILSGSLHGWIRTAHAARALGEEETPQRLRELAFGLAVWASWYEELAAPIIGEPMALDAWLASVPTSTGEVKGLIDARVATAAASEEVRRWVGRLRVEGESDTIITQLSTAAARALWGAPPSGVSGHLHALTAASALRPLLPWIDWEALAPSFVHAFGALLAAHPRGEPPKLDTSAEALRAIAGEHDDDHVIKVIEAALREHAFTEDEVYLRAAAYAASQRG